MNEAGYAQDRVPEIVLGIPFTLQDRSALEAGVAQYGRVLMTGNLVTEKMTRMHAEVDVRGRDGRFALACAVASGNRIPESEMKAITGHNMMVYLVGKGGSLESARFMSRIGKVFLLAGGHCVKVESSGIAHSKSKWLERADSDFSFDLFNKYVVFAGDAQQTYSCGMHALGYRDSILPKPLSEQSVDELRTLLMYSILPSPPLLDGHTIGPSEDMGAYRLRLVDCKFYASDDLFFNPYGMMYLEPR